MVDKNVGKIFWEGLDYIIDSIKQYGNWDDKNENFEFDHKSITVLRDEWETVDEQFSKLEQAVLDTWEDAVQMADDLEEMKWLGKEDAETYRKSCQEMAESIMERLEKYVDDNKVEI